LWERARNEHSTPREIGWSIAVGVFAGCTPFVGFHMWIALAFATVLRLNRLWAFLGSRVSFTPLLSVIALCEIEGAHRIRTGAWASLRPGEVLARGTELLGDWLLGALFVGGPLAAALGLAAYVCAQRWQTPTPGPGAALTGPP
jgi:uncharacterized protein (DUF2062 family)